MANVSDDVGVRQRRRKTVTFQLENAGKDAEDSSKSLSELFTVEKGSYWLTRVVFLRCLAFIYGVAFLIALNQNRQLIGKNGLLPANIFLTKVHSQSTASSAWYPKLLGFFMRPSVLWFTDWTHNVDFFLDALAYIGVTISVLVVATGCANMIAMFTLWICYQSIVNVGQTWYSFGWESQLLETGFLGIFLCPLWTWKKIPHGTPTPSVVVWGYRWLLFRIMIGAGLIKIRGDKCWMNLTCMNYHYQTQPVPNPLSYYLHQLPEYIHIFETLSNHFVELIVPWFTFFNRPLQMLCGIIQILFQVALISSGNLSFLNWLTILPSIWYFDDVVWSCLFSRANLNEIHQAQRKNTRDQKKKARDTVHLMLGITICVFSVPVVLNLLSPRQAMNTSFEPFHILNTYGAFGSVTKTRTEVILQGTYSEDPRDPSAEWLEYEFKCKPGNVTRRPCLISPYHYCLDWLMWFAAFQRYEVNPWLVHLIAKLLTNDADMVSLMAVNPFVGKDPPKFIRAEHYIYKFTKIGSKESKDGMWWERQHKGSYMPPVSLETLVPYLNHLGWTKS